MTVYLVRSVQVQEHGVFRVQQLVINPFKYALPGKCIKVVLVQVQKVTETEGF